MYYNQYEFGNEDRETRFMKKMPQFFNTTTEEIQKILASIDAIDIEEARRETSRKLAAERAEDFKYLEENRGAPILPLESVKIQLGVRTSPSMMDTNGFIDSEDLLRCRRGWKLSLGKKHIYLGL